MNNSTTINTMENTCKKYEAIIFDLDGTLYHKQGLVRRMILRLWWCLPLLISERIARKKIVTCAYDSPERFYEAFFQTMARGHWWNAKIAQRWYHTIYLPTMVRIIATHQPPNTAVIFAFICNAFKALAINGHFH